MKYLSLFSGIGGFELAIHSIFPEAVCIGFSEIDKYAIQTYQKHYPEHVNLGDITKIGADKLTDLDLIVGGFPCQDLSIAKNYRKGLDGKRSGLFWDMIRIIEVKQPRYFLLENVASMPAMDKGIISRAIAEATGYSTCSLSPYVEPVMIDAALVSAQSRKRYFWCNWEVKQPEDRGILLKDILGIGEINQLKSKTVRPSGRGSGYGDKHNWDTIRIGHFNTGGQGNRVYSTEGKSVSLSAKTTGLYEIGQTIRKPTPTECERLQCFPDGYTEGVSATQRYRQLGNAVNVEVVKHILQELKEF